MEYLSLATPSILFSAISLIMLAYTNRFLAYAAVVRGLKAQYSSNPSPHTEKQIANLRRRLYLTRTMQVLGTGSLFVCVLCTFFIYINWNITALYMFGVSILLLVGSLGVSLVEILISVKALEVYLDDASHSK